MFEDHIKTEAVHPRGPSPLPNQQVPRPFFQTTSYLPRGTDRPNLQQPRPIAPSVFMATSRPVDRSNGLKGKLSGQKIDKDKPRWDPIPITYTKLFPKLVEIGHIEPVQLAHLKPPFPRWYNAHTRCDYHGRNPDHPTENCTALKHKVQDLINDGKLKFEDLDRLVGVEDSSRTKVKMTRQKKETPKEANFGKATIPKEKVPIAKVGSSSTTEGLKERSCEPNGKEEKMVL